MTSGRPLRPTVGEALRGGRLWACPCARSASSSSRGTYDDGETVRKCELDLAPEAPWRCPDNCPKYERRLADVNWAHGSLVTPPTPEEPPGVGNGDDVAALLDEAEDIVNEAGPRIKAEVDAEQGTGRGGRWKRWFGRG